MNRASLSLLALALVACSANITDGRFQCSDDDPCPNGFQCLAQHCYHNGASPDGGVGAPCTENCVSVTVTNAAGASYAGMSYMVEGQPFAMPHYGETTPPFQIGLGTNGQLDLALGMTTGRHMASPRDGFVVAFVTTPTAGWVVLPSPQGSPASGTSTARILDAIADPTGGAQHGITTADSASGHLLSRDTSAFDFALPDNGRQPLALGRINGSGGGAMIAAFDPSTFPPDALYYAFVSGRTDAHLGAPDGLRLIAAVPGTNIVPSLPLVWAVNAADGAVEFCDMMTGTLLLSVPQNALAGPFIGTVAPRTLVVHDARTTDNCASTDTYAFTTLQLPSGYGGSARMIVASVGVLGTTGSGMTWGAGGGFEGPPLSSAATATTQMVAYADLSITLGLTVGTTGAENTLMIAARAADYHEWPMRPSNLVVAFDGMTPPTTLAWDPMTPAAAALVVTDGMGHDVALELSMPFGEDWHLDVEPHP